MATARYALRAWLGVLALGELLDDLGAERRQVVRVARAGQARRRRGPPRRPRSPPAFSRSVFIDGHEVSVRPSGDVGLDQRPRPVADHADRLLLLEERAHEADRRPRPCAGSPGWRRRRAARARRSRRRRRPRRCLSTLNVSPLSRWLKAWTSPSSSEISSGVPPACSTAFHGSVSSTCSTPSVARNAIVLPVEFSSHGPWRYPAGCAVSSRVERRVAARYGIRHRRRAGAPDRRPASSPSSS